MFTYDFAQTQSPIQSFQHISINNKFSYFTSYLWNLTKGLVQEHQPLLDRELPCYQIDIKLSETEKKIWSSFFNGDSSKQDLSSLIAHMPCSSQVIVQYAKKLNIAYKNIAFLASNIRIPQNIEDYYKTDALTLVYHYEGAEQFGKQSSIGKFITLIYNKNNQLLVEHTHYLHIRNASTDNKLNDSFVQKMKQGKSRLSLKKKEKPTKHQTISIMKGLGVKFGILSGDFNVFHIFDSTAKRLGKKKAFIQGMCTYSLVLSRLNDVLKSEVHNIAINFTRPVFHDQALTLYSNDEQFELIDADGKAVAHGEFTLKR